MRLVVSLQQMLTAAASDGTSDKTVISGREILLNMLDSTCGLIGWRMILWIQPSAYVIADSEVGHAHGDKEYLYTRDFLSDQLPGMLHCQSCCFSSGTLIEQDDSS